MATKGKGGDLVQKMNDLPAQIEARKKAWNLDDLADLLSVDRTTLYRMVRARRLPSYRIGTLIRLDPKTTANWLRGTTI